MRRCPLSVIGSHAGGVNMGFPAEQPTHFATQGSCDVQFSLIFLGHSVVNWPSSLIRFSSQVLRSQMAQGTALSIVSFGVDVAKDLDKYYELWSG
jgi:hypothetical protein